MKPVLAVGNSVGLQRMCVLARRAGTPIELVRSGAKGLLRMLRGDVAALVIDLETAGVTARELVLSLRSIDELAACPVLLAHAEEREEEALALFHEVQADAVCVARSAVLNDTLQRLLQEEEDRCPSDVPLPSVGSFAVSRAPRGRVGGHRLGAVLGDGGFGTVFASLDDPGVAIKLLHPYLLADPRDRVRFLRELAAMQLVSGPHLARLLDWGRVEERYYLVLERIDGESLASGIERHGTLSPEFVTKLGRCILKAIQACAAANLVHRDVNPSNILVRRDGTPLLIDFGLARLRGSTAVSQKNEVMGTAYYLAPEVTRGAPECLASDLYSLGATLYEALSGRPPYQAENCTALLIQISRPDVRPPELATLRPDLPSWLERAVMSLISSEPNERFVGARYFANHQARIGLAA